MNNTVYTIITMGAAILPCILCIWGMYLLNKKRVAKRVAEIEAGTNSETVQFAGRRKLSTINMIAGGPGIMIGALLLFKYLSADYFLFLILGIAFLILCLLIVFVIIRSPLYVLTDRTLYTYPLYGYSATVQSYALEQLHYEEGCMGRYPCLLLYEGDKIVGHTYEMPKGTEDFVRSHCRKKD